MNCTKCKQPVSSRENLGLIFCLDCDIWYCEDYPPTLTPSKFCAIIPEKPIPLTAKEMRYARQRLKKLGLIR